MAFSLRDILRFFHGGPSKPKPVFQTEKEAYEFCRKVYNANNGVTPELRKAYEFYQKNYNDDTGTFLGPESNPHLPSLVKGRHSQV